MATSFSPTMSSPGIGSGLDVNSIVSQLMVVERQPIVKLQTAAATMQTQLSAFGQLQSLVSGLKDAAAPLHNADSFALTTSGSSDPQSVSAASTTKAIPGTYSVAVQSLSATQTLVSPTGQFTAATDVVGTGSLTLRLGTWSAGQTAFTPKTGSSDVTIAITAADNTLEKIRDKINAANAGVSASIVTDTNGARLSLQSASTGAENGFRISVADDDGDNADALGLSRLAFDPPGGAGRMTLAQSAANAQATINGIAVSSATNTLNDVVDGMTFIMSKVTASPVTVTVNRNTDAIKGLVNKFATAYNALNQFLSDATKYDTTTKRAALLQGDSTTVGIQNQLRGLLGQRSGASTAFGTLSDLGVQLQKDGSLKVNDTKLNAAIANLPELTKALSTVDTTSSFNNGFGKRFSAWADGLLASTGTLPGRQDSIKKRMTANQKDQDRMADRMADIEQRLRAQYSALDRTMANSQALNKFVTQQFAPKVDTSA